MPGESVGGSSQGSQGSKGSMESQGSKGSIGSQGSIISQGSIGSKGSKGSQDSELSPDLLSVGSLNEPEPAITRGCDSMITSEGNDPSQVSPKARIEKNSLENVKITAEVPEEEATAKQSLGKPEAIILDFFGTTTIRKFIAEVLLPFIKQEIDNYLKEYWNDKMLQKDISRIRKDQSNKQNNFTLKIKESSEPEEEVRKSIVEYINSNIEQKKNDVGANRVMKRIWNDGYEKGKLKTPIFEDVPTALEKWKQENIKIYSFSSNSVDSQKLFYKSTDRGDILFYFTDFFDKSTGKKDNPETYRKIVTKISISGDKILYINDGIRGAKAAKEIELNTVLIVRQGNKEIKEKYKKAFTCVSSFNEIQF